MDITLEWLRPAGLVLLGWLVPLWIFLRRKQQPARLAVGTLDIWKGIGDARVEQAERRSPRIPPRAWLWILGILLGSLASMGPSWKDPSPSTLQRLVLDRSPSMFLPTAPGSSTTRYDEALELALLALDKLGDAGTTREWQTAGQPVVRAQQPPTQWHVAPREALPELDAAVFEDPALQVVTDHARPSAGGLFASGGQAIPGTIGSWEAAALNWDGVRIREGDALRLQEVAVEGVLPERLAQLLSIWIEERGLRLAEPSAASALLIRCVPADPLQEQTASRDGWELQGRGAALPELGAAWLWTHDGRPLVTRSDPGVLNIGLQSIESVTGDPAAWAVSWATLLDESLLAPEGRVALAERLDAGQAQSRPGPGTRRVPGKKPLPPAAWLALGCLLAAVLAFFPRAVPGEI